MQPATDAEIQAAINTFAELPQPNTGPQLTFTFRGVKYLIQGYGGHSISGDITTYITNTIMPALLAGRTPPVRDPALGSASPPTQTGPTSSGQYIIYPTKITTATVIVPILNVRAAPISTAPLAGSDQLKQGDTFAVDGWTNGTVVSGEGRWWHSKLGHYVWVGGTREKP